MESVTHSLRLVQDELKRSFVKKNATLINIKHSGKIAALIIPSVSVHIVHGNVLGQFIVNHTPLACQDVVSVAHAITFGTVLVMV